MLDFEQVTVAFELIRLIKKEPSLLASTEAFGDWLHNLESHLDYSLED